MALFGFYFPALPCTVYLQDMQGLLRLDAAYDIEKAFELVREAIIIKVDAVAQK